MVTRLEAYLERMGKLEDTAKHEQAINGPDVRKRAAAVKFLEDEFPTAVIDLNKPTEIASFFNEYRKNQYTRAEALWNRNRNEILNDGSLEDKLAFNAASVNPVRGVRGEDVYEAHQKVRELRRIAGLYANDTLPKHNMLGAIRPEIERDVMKRLSEDDEDGTAQYVSEDIKKAYVDIITFSIANADKETQVEIINRLANRAEEEFIKCFGAEEHDVRPALADYARDNLFRYSEIGDEERGKAMEFLYRIGTGQSLRAAA